jgi:hypothetical protein
MRMIFSLLALALAACGGTGTVRLALSIAGGNDRELLVDFGGQPRAFTVDNVIVILESASLAGDQEAGLLAALTPAVFRLEPGVEVLSAAVEAGSFEGLELGLDIADALTAANAEEPNVFGRSFHLQGSIDADGDGAVETGIVVYAPAAQALTLPGALRVRPGEELVVEVVIDLGALLAGVDFTLAENTGTELALTEDNTVDQTPRISANVPLAFSLR